MVLQQRPGPAALELHMAPAIDMSREQFFQFCQLNQDVRIERNAEGGIAVMTPAGGETGARNGFLVAALYRWAEEDGTGVAFGSSTGFELPNRAVRAPDAAWVLRNRLARLSPEDKERFLPLCPDFVVELLSPSDSRAAARRKMEEYRANGARLGWLIDPARGRSPSTVPTAASNSAPNRTSSRAKRSCRGSRSILPPSPPF